MEATTIKKHLPVKIEDYEVNPDAFSTAVDNSDLTEKELTTVLTNKNRRVFLLPRTTGTNAYILSEILKIAKAYGANKMISEEVQLECVKLMKSQFKKYSMPEVWLAYRMHSSGKLENDKGRGEMYGGNFTARSFAAVLAAWDEYKSSAVAAYINEEAKLKSEEEDRRRNEIMKSESWDKFLIIINKLRDKADVDWRDCLAYQYVYLKDRGILKLEKEEWKSIWEDAENLAKAEVSFEKENPKKGKIRLIGDVAKKVQLESIAARRIVIARKLAVYRKVILNPDFSFEKEEVQ